MPRGTGVAVYGASLAAVLAQAGHRIEGVFGLNAGAKAQTREVLFHDHFGQGHRVSQKEIERKVTRSVIFNHLARKLRSVPLTGKIDTRSLGFRMPAFDAIWTSPYLYEVAYARFKYLGLFTTVILPDPPEVMHWTYPIPVRLAGARNIYTVHDLVPLRLPQTTLDDKRYYYRLVAKCLRVADHICTVSEASRADIHSLFSIDPDKVTNTYQSSPVPPQVLASTPEADAAIAKDMFGLKHRDFYLFFGALDPKKNIERIIEGFLTSQSKAQLVIVSARDWGMSGESRVFSGEGKVFGRRFGRRILLLDYLPRPTLFRLIRSARAVLFPSLYEGFGLPALEAIQLGTPVISSRTSSLPEVVGEAGLLVDPYRSNEIADAIRALENDDGLYARLQASGPKQAAKFSDDAYRQRLDAMYRQVCAPVK